MTGWHAKAAFWGRFFRVFVAWHGCCEESVTMKQLALKPILSNLREAQGELMRLFARIQFIVFGEVMDESVKELEKSVAQEERRQSLTEGALFVSMAHAYHHLNFAWNCRHAPEERVWRYDPADFKRWSKFPKGAAFHDLWPAPSRCHGTTREPRQEKINPNSLQAAFLQMAVRKLAILSYRVSCALGDDSPEKVPRPKGLNPEVEAEPFTEEAFDRRMHRIYGEMNRAWAYRKRTAGGSNSRQAIHRRSQFPRPFIGRT